MANEENIQNEQAKHTITLKQGADGNSLIDVYVDGEVSRILWSDIAPFWKSGEKHLVKSVGAFIQPPAVIGWCCYADGSKGVVFVWDIKTKKIIHVSEGSYVRKAIIYGNLVFTLREIPKPDINEIILCIAPGPMLDADEKKKVNALPLGIKIFDKKFNIENYKLGIKDGSVFAGFRNEVKEVKINFKKNDDGSAEPSKPVITS